MVKIVYMIYLQMSWFTEFIYMPSSVWKAWFGTGSNRILYKLTDTLPSRLSKDGPVLVLYRVVSSVRVLGHAHPRVRVVELAVEDAARAALLLGAEHVLVTALGLRVGVLRALGLTGPTIVHIHLILYIPLNSGNTITLRLKSVCNHEHQGKTNPDEHLTLDPVNFVLKWNCTL